MRSCVPIINYLTLTKSRLRFGMCLISLLAGILLLPWGLGGKIRASCTAPSFAATASFSAGTKPYSVAVGDFNGDRKLDLASANPGSGNVSILLGDGTGKFGAAANFAAGTNPASVAVGDFNKDGKQDLAVANSGSRNVSILLGDGTGKFSAATNFAVGTNPVSVAVGDFNKDGNQDLAVANSGTNNVSILLGSATGAFGAATNLAVGTSPTSVVVGDFNKDGNQDLAVANLGSNNISVLLGSATGAFGAATNISIGTVTVGGITAPINAPRTIAVGDFNKDGIQDLVTADAGTNNVNVASSGVTILLGNGIGGFGTPTTFPVASLTVFVAVGEFNGDGNLDVVTATEGTDNVSILLGNGIGGFGAVTNFSVGANAVPTSVAVGDFNGDGKPDVASTNYAPNTVGVLLNTCP